MPATNMHAVGGPPEGTRNSAEPGRTFKRVQNMARSSRAPGVAVANLGIVFDTSASNRRKCSSCELIPAALNDLTVLGSAQLGHPSLQVVKIHYWFTPDLLAQHKNIVGFFAGGIHDCAEHGEVWVAKLGPTLAGVAAWLPPGVFPATGGTRALRQGLRVAPTIVRGRQRRTAYKLLNEMTARHPHEEHWYLTMLATDPLYQGRGIGKALVEPTLARADETGVATYLETAKESNLAYYPRLGFEIVDKFSVDASPRLWQMQREPH